jgi:2-polyprenyl-3-methyl-5-hydroxy-6-metoxy-1,4-benzoquinol methylase
MRDELCYVIDGRRQRNPKSMTGSAGAKPGHPKTREGVVMVDVLPYQQQCLETISRFTAFSRKEVLEIGGDVDGNVANKLIEFGASDVWSINVDTRYSDQDISNVHTRQLSAYEIERYFGNNAFDVVFGIAVLEHIDDIQRLCETIKGVVRPGGLVYLQGGPFWTCCHGHHLVYFADGRFYTFTGDNPVPDWLHLLQGAPEAAETLKQNNVPLAHAEAIVEQIYNGTQINRAQYSEIKQTLYNTNLNLFYLEEHIRRKPDELILSKLTGRGWNKSEPFGVYSADFVFLP